METSFGKSRLKYLNWNDKHYKISYIIKLVKQILFAFSTLISNYAFAQLDSIALKDITWDKSAPAGSKQLFIPSANSLLAGIIYSPTSPH